jgi:hypothetical protein
MDLTLSKGSTGNVMRRAAKGTKSQSPKGALIK